MILPATHDAVPHRTIEATINRTPKVRRGRRADISTIGVLDGRRAQFTVWHGSYWVCVKISVSRMCQSTQGALKSSNRTGFMNLPLQEICDRCFARRGPTLSRVALVSDRRGPVKSRVGDCCIDAVGRLERSCFGCWASSDCADRAASAARRDPALACARRSVHCAVSRSTSG